MTKIHPIDRLYATIKARRKASARTSYTAKLLQEGAEKCAKKFGEESFEVALAAACGTKKQVAAESADVLYHLLVLWASRGVAPKDVYAALKAREARSGLAEKASRKS
jgi:phosphoribosyl-ATP pyrophosphohydrolase